MRMKKVYGQSRKDVCVWCGKVATVQNEAGLLVCVEHKNREMPAIRCTCGDWLDLKAGKYGPYFNCFNCGNISFAKGMELKELAVPGKKKPKKETLSEAEQAIKDGKSVYVDGEFIISIDDL